MKNRKIIRTITLSSLATILLVPVAFSLVSCVNISSPQIIDGNYFNSLGEEKAKTWFYQYDPFFEKQNETDQFGYKYVVAPIYDIDYNDPDLTKNIDANGWMKMNEEVTFKDFFINKKVAQYFENAAGGETTLSDNAKAKMANYFAAHKGTLSLGPNLTSDYGMYYHDLQKENSIKIFANPYFCQWLTTSNITKIDLSYNDLKYFPNMALAGADKNSAWIDKSTSILPYDNINGFSEIDLEYNKLSFLDFNLAHLIKYDANDSKNNGKLLIDYNYLPYIYHQGKDGLIDYRSTYQYFNQNTDPTAPEWKKNQYIADRVKYTFVSKEGIVESLIASSLKIGLFQKDGILIDQNDIYNFVCSLNNNFNAETTPSQVLDKYKIQIFDHINNNFLTSQVITLNWADSKTMYPEIEHVIKISTTVTFFADNYSGQYLCSFCSNGIFKSGFNFSSINANITSETTVAELLEILRQDYQVGQFNTLSIYGFKTTKFLTIILICIFGSIGVGITGLCCYEFIYLKMKNKKRIAAFKKKERSQK